MLHGTTKLLAWKFKNPERPAKDMNRRLDYFLELLKIPLTQSQPFVKSLLEKKIRGLSQNEIWKGSRTWWHASRSLESRPGVFSRTVLPAFWKDIGERVHTARMERRIPYCNHLKLPKKGHLNNCNNYRGITLLLVRGKNFNRILLERIKNSVDPKLRNELAGFRKNRSCTN